MSFFRALGAGYLYVRASAVEAKGNSRLKTENGPLGRRDRAKWNRSKVTPLNKYTESWADDSQHILIQSDQHTFFHKLLF